MEGISHETASLAGHLALDKLIVLYDSNDISLDGDLDRSFSDSTEQRFKAYGWQVIRVEDGNDLTEISAAIKAAKENTTQPTLIEVKTIIGYETTNKSNSSASHGATLGKDESKLTKEYYNWSHEPLHVTDDVYEDLGQKVQSNGADQEAKWNELFNQYKEQFPELGEELKLAIANELPKDWAKELPTYEAGKDELATRVASSDVINSIAKTVRSLFGGVSALVTLNILLWT